MAATRGQWWTLVVGICTLCLTAMLAVFGSVAWVAFNHGRHQQALESLRENVDLQFAGVNDRLDVIAKEASRAYTENRIAGERATEIKATLDAQVRLGLPIQLPLMEGAEKEN